MIPKLHSLAMTLLVAFLVGIPSTVLAQPQSDEFNFDDIPLDEGALPYIGVGGGYIAMFSFMDFTELNALNATLGLENFGDQLLMHGGGGWTVIGLIPNLRFGVYGAGGSTTKSADVSIGGQSLNRTTRFDVGFTAAHIDYAIPLLFPGFAVVPGVMVGAVSNTFKVVQTETDGASLSDLIGGFPPSGSPSDALNNNRQATMTRSTLFLYPVLNLEYAITQFAMIRIGGGYQFTGPGNWNDTEGVAIVDVPEGIKSDGLMLNAGIFLGLFQQ